MHNLSICREMIISSGKEKKNQISFHSRNQYCNQEGQPWTDAAQETVLGESMVLIVMINILILLFYMVQYFITFFT